MLERAKEILLTEAKAVENLVHHLDESFVRAVEFLQQTQGRVICTGMGKPGLIARKIAATMASTGTPAFYVHPAEAIHGDIGMIKKEDTVLAMSHSGETEEIVRMIPLVAMLGSRLIAMTGNKESTLAKHSDVVLDVSIEKEACSLGLVPSASSTVALAMGDALAIVLYEEKGFRLEDFARLHPGGELGRKLLLCVSDVMRPLKQTPIIEENRTVKDAVEMISSHSAGAVLIVDQHENLKGIFTDGDLRRGLLTQSGMIDLTIKDVMTKDPLFVQQSDLSVEVLRCMNDNKVDELPVLDDSQKVVGIVDIQDLLNVGII